MDFSCPHVRFSGAGNPATSYLTGARPRLVGPSFFLFDSQSRDSRINKGSGPFKEGLWITPSKNGSVIGGGVKHLRPQLFAINPPEAIEGIQRQKRNGAGWTTEDSFWVSGVEVVAHYPEENVLG